MTPTPQQPTPVTSPCIKICMLDQEGVCEGCGRSLEEIASWSRLTPEDQQQVVDRAALRRELRNTGD